MTETVVLNGKPSFKSKGSNAVKPSENQQQLDIEKQEFEQALRQQREELTTEAEAEVESFPEELTESHQYPSRSFRQELVKKEEGEFVLTADELARIISAAQGGAIEPHLALRMPEDLSGAAKAGYIVDDALGEVGRGMHRVADGCRDILGGAIDIVTIGRAHRK